jgi:hypothetical protein
VLAKGTRIAIEEVDSDVEGAHSKKERGYLDVMSAAFSHLSVPSSALGVARREGGESSDCGSWRACWQLCSGPPCVCGTCVQFVTPGVCSGAPDAAAPLTFVSAYAQHAMHRALASAGPGATASTCAVEDYCKFEPAYTTMIPSFRNTLDYVFMQEGR